MTSYLTSLPEKSFMSQSGSFVFSVLLIFSLGQLNPHEPRHTVYFGNEDPIVTRLMTVT